MSTNDKVRRWTDLLAALLRFHFGATFEQLAREVPDYAHDADDPQDVARVKRTFERDKDELRAFGVPIETRLDAEENESKYVLKPRAFYLPYLVLADGEARSEPRRIRRDGYQALQTLAFEPDELAAVGAAAARVRALGDPLLAADAESAMRKLAFDLPLGALAAPERERVVARAEAASTLEALTDALLGRKVVTFEYRTMERDEVETRAVEPYGLAFVSCAWYLVGRDRAREAIRRFRVSRIARPKVNPKSRNTPDFDVPGDFSLSEHAGARQAWELGDGDELVAEVQLRAHTGTAMAAARLGSQADRRRFVVRRPDAFVRWLLSFAGDAVPLAPASLVADYRRQAAAVAALYGEARS